MEITPGRWVARVKDWGSEPLPLGAARKAAIDFYRSRGKGDPDKDWIRENNLQLAAALDKDEPPSSVGRLRAWITPLEDGAYRIRVPKLDSGEQLFAIDRSVDPECETAKGLFARGHTGKCYLLNTETGWPLTVFDVEERVALGVEMDGNPPSTGALNPDGPGALQGDDYPLEYDSAGNPELPACLDRRRKHPLAEAA